jgi:hypothetical protein
MFFTDETGQEDFADPQYPVFEMGGCAILAGAIDRDIRGPWRKMKADHFGGWDIPLHANELRDPTEDQIKALAQFFTSQQFARFAVTMTPATKIQLHGYAPIEAMPGLLRNRWQDLAPRFFPLPVEIAFIHEASERGDPLLQTYFGESVATINGVDVPVHHALMPKGDEALEVADFVVQAAGAQARRGIDRAKPVRRDFDVIFRSNPAWSSFLAC